MTPAEIAELRTVSESLAAAGCSKSRQILWLLHDRDETDYGRQCVDTLIRDHDKQTAGLKTINIALAEKLRICSETIVGLAERCAAQSELLAKLAEKQST